MLLRSLPCILYHKQLDYSLVNSYNIMRRNIRTQFRLMLHISNWGKVLVCYHGPSGVAWFVTMSHYTALVLIQHINNYVLSSIKSICHEWAIWHIFLHMTWFNWMEKNLNISIMANTNQSPPTFSFLCNNSQAKVLYASIRLCDHETKVWTWVVDWVHSALGLWNCSDEGYIGHFWKWELNRKFSHLLQLLIF